MTTQPYIREIPLIHKIIISAIITVAMLGLFENAARIYEPITNDPFSLNLQFGGDADHGNFLRDHTKFIRDPALFWKIRPNLRYIYYNRYKNKMVTESTNSLGFRGKTEFGAIKENTCRVLALGDSWTYGVLVEDDETYPYRLSQLLLNSSADKRFEVLNLGCVGYSSHQGKLLARQYVDKLEPDIIVACFGANDSRRTRLFADKGQPTVSEWAISMQRLLSKSAFYNLLRNLILRLKKEMRNAGRSSSLAENWPQRVSPDDYENNLEDIISLGEKRNSGVILMCYLGGGPYREKAEKLAERRKIPFVDIHRVLHTNPDYSVEELSIDYPRDTHPNAKGYSLIAKSIHDRIDLINENR